MFLVLLGLLTIFQVSLYSQDFWVKTSYPSGTQLHSVYSLLGLPDNSILAGTFYFGVMRSFDNGSNWVNSGFDSMWVRKLARDSRSNIYALVIGGIDGSKSGLYKSTNNGYEWNRIWANPGGGNCLYIDNQDNIYIGLNFYEGQGGIYFFNGTNWTNIFPYQANVYAITKTTTGKILAATYQSGFAKIYYSVNNGLSWESYSFGINFTTSDMIIDKQNSIYLASNGYGIYLSTNDGISFQRIANTGPEYSSLYIDGNTLYAASNGYGVFKTTNRGELWEIINSGIPFQERYVLSLGATPNGYLYAGMNYYGIYRSTNQVVEVEEENVKLDEFRVYQNFPNPFNPVTKIKYVLKEKQPVEIRLFDLLGKEIALILNEIKNAGVYEIEINANTYSLSSGVYFYQIKAGKYQAIKKMVLLK